MDGKQICKKLDKAKALSNRFSWEVGGVGGRDRLCYIIIYPLGEAHLPVFEVRECLSGASSAVKMYLPLGAPVAEVLLLARSGDVGVEMGVGEAGIMWKLKKNQTKPLCHDISPDLV